MITICWEKTIKCLYFGNFIEFTTMERKYYLTIQKSYRLTDFQNAY